MTKKISVNGREISVKEEDFEYLIEQLEDKGFQVDDLEGWQTKVTHEPYDFNVFIQKAKEYSALICVKEFYLKKFGILIKSHAAKSKLLDAICVGLNVEQAIEVKNAWTKAEKSHSNFYEMKLVTEDDRKALLESIKEMAAIIEQADVDAVKNKLKQLDNLGSITIRYVQKEAFQIGNNSYDYNRVVL
ncbi:hypothetical protein M3Y96_00246400 [Aphelenchoides besseyi]|nr:hypothetical protein M3Y96_00246400 [Aphelenchoides besseyi]